MTKKEKILETAMKLFSQNGIQSTSTASIAKQSGVATGTLFHHFKTKEELVFALYDMLFTYLINFHKKYFDETQSSYERLKKLWFLNLEWVMENKEYANFLERYTFSNYVNEEKLANTMKRFDYYIRVIGDLISEDFLKFDNFEYIMEHFSWNMKMNARFFMSNSDLYTPKVLEKTFEIYWSGISK